jgi:FtsX-like permease family
VRAAARRKEIAIRLYIGAGRWRLIRQFLTESFLLALAGGALGLFISRWAKELLSVFYTTTYSNLQLHYDLSLSPRALVYALALTLFTGLLFGLLHGTIIRLGDLIFGSSGTSGPAPLTAVNVKTGEVVWQDRAFPKANFVYADGKLILLDEDGQLALVRLSPQGMKVLTKAAVLEHIAWTPPTLVGTNLYLRDRRMIVALDLR